MADRPGPWIEMKAGDTLYPGRGVIVDAEGEKLDAITREPTDGRSVWAFVLPVLAIATVVALAIGLN
jgi:hypothetical protein